MRIWIAKLRRSNLEITLETEKMYSIPVEGLGKNLKISNCHFCKKNQ
jgi:hypothetical protein